MGFSSILKVKFGDPIRINIRPLSLDLLALTNEKCFHALPTFQEGIIMIIIRWLRFLIVEIRITTRLIHTVGNEFLNFYSTINILSEKLIGI